MKQGSLIPKHSSIHSSNCELSLGSQGSYVQAIEGRLISWNIQEGGYWGGRTHLPIDVIPRLSPEKRDYGKGRSPHCPHPPLNLNTLFSLPKVPTHRATYDRITCPSPLPFVLTNAKEQESECLQHSSPLLWPVLGHEALQGLKGFVTQQVMRSKSTSILFWSFKFSWDH